MSDMKINSAPVNNVGLLKEVKPNENKKNQGVDFHETFFKQMEKADAKAALKDQAQKADEAKNIKPLLKFSNHALERMSTRGISFSPDQITKIEQGMQKATAKGAKETLVLTDDSALIVSLKNSTVVTVMDKAMLKENVFTNIDSTVFV